MAKPLPYKCTLQIRTPPPRSNHSTFTISEPNPIDPPTEKWHEKRRNKLTAQKYKKYHSPFATNRTSYSYVGLSPTKLISIPIFKYTHHTIVLHESIARYRVYFSEILRTGTKGKAKVISYSRVQILLLLLYLRYRRRRRKRGRKCTLNIKFFARSLYCLLYLL